MSNEATSLEQLCVLTLASRASLIALALLVSGLVVAMYLLYRSMIRMQQLESRIAKLENDICSVGSPAQDAQHGTPEHEGSKYLSDHADRADTDAPSRYLGDLRQSHSRTNSLGSNSTSYLDQETDGDSKGESSPLFLPRTRSMGELHMQDTSPDAQSRFHWVSGGNFSRTESSISHQTVEFESTIAHMRTRSFSMSGQEDAQLPRSNSWSAHQDRSPLGRASRRSPVSSEVLPNKRGPLRKYSASSSSGARFYAKVVDRRG
ncbi:hypothetical protein GUITHDRAFT_117311 [Guillardia theta CCMP2712]|uniref:Uncharacterized protein n=1 Tax=Guillardia theta (strain CCMP2712) TaxID=905079 RepID=L1IJW5_GUITC|nr:hypothetical protein GUITHDRAFT_117311 [Guillardia theta CCMP2712]EKX36531.1 hypothetical protein GUITHDRAFT_117311 [Guillardia theta CCMP2712]|eukprot:XP_005823511.1 hypothetical protein GUITHDRAFT_117311 [Guillardia theta CCMP2712]